MSATVICRWSMAARRPARRRRARPRPHAAAPAPDAARSRAEPLWSVLPPLLLGLAGAGAGPLRAAGLERSAAPRGDGRGSRVMSPPTIPVACTMAKPSRWPDVPPCHADRLSRRDRRVGWQTAGGSPPCSRSPAATASSSSSAVLAFDAEAALRVLVASAGRRKYPSLTAACPASPLVRTRNLGTARHRARRASLAETDPFLRRATRVPRPWPPPQPTATLRRHRLLLRWTARKSTKWPWGRSTPGSSNRAIFASSATARRSTIWRSRSGYQHRGVERALVGGPDPRTIHYVETLAGDTSIGHAIAYCRAVEALAADPRSRRAPR